MYADRHARRRLSPGSLSVSLGITGAMIAGLIFANPKIIRNVDHALTIHDVTLPPLPPPEPPKPQPRTPAPQPKITAPLPPIPLPLPTNPPIAIDLPPLPPVSPGLGEGNGPVSLPTAPATPIDPPAPPLVGPEVDPRYADALQPDYPPEERRAERGGRVELRVLVGTDGRVKQVERVNATSDAFFAATQRQALAHWRFRPAHRGSSAVEAWRAMTVTFVLEAGG